MLDTDTWPILRRGTWLYDGSVSVEVRVLESAEFWGSGDYEDDEDVREDREELCYFLAYEMAGAPGVFCNLIPNLATLDAAIVHAETKFPGIHWEDTMTLCENSNLHVNRTSASLRVAATGSSDVGLLKRNLMDNIDRNRKRAWNDEQKDLARAAFPLPDELMEQLFSAVDQALEVDGCDHTLRFTESWLNRNGSDRQTTIAWLKEHGGYCDCEVIANACDYWEQSR